MNYLQPGLDLEDEDALLEDASTPYDSLTERIEKPDFTEMSIADKQPDQMPQNPVADMISKRYAGDPLFKQFQAQQDDLDSDRNSKRQADVIANIGNAFSQFAQGSNAPKQNAGLFENLSKQSGDFLKTREQDLDRQGKVLAAIEARKGREGLLGFRKDQIAQAEKTKQDRLSSMNIGRANSLFTDTGINRETTKLNAARSAQTLINGVKEGHLKGSKNIRNQLTTIMSTIEMGGPGAVSDREAMGVNNLYTKAKDAMAFIESHPNDSIPPEYLDQLEVEANALGDRAAVNYKNLVSGKLSGADLSGGNPDIDPGQIHRLATQRQSTFLKSNGYDPETGLPTGRKNSGMSLINSAEAGQKQVLKKQYSPSRNQTKIIYKDGSEEIIDGQR